MLCTSLSIEELLPRRWDGLNLAGVVVAGHSLGGALATLAAFDIRRHLLDNMHSDAEVVCYTFAAPRTGNHAFAREYNAMVPDSWSVINDQVSLRLCLVAIPRHQSSNQSRASQHQ